MGGMNLAAFAAPAQYVRPIDPFQGAREFYTLQALAQQRQLQQQEIADAQQRQQIQGVQLQQAQRSLQDDQMMRQAYMESGGDLDKTEQLLMQRGGSPKAVQDLRTYRLDLGQKMAKLDEDKLKNQAARHDQLRGAAIAFGQQPDDVKQQQYGQWLQDQVKAGNMTPEEYAQGIAAHPTYPGDQQWQVLTNGLRTGTQAAEEILKQREDERKAAAEGRAQQLFPPQLQEVQAKATREQMVLDAMKKAQQAQASGQHPIDAILPSSLDPTINASYKAAYDSAMSGPPDQNGRHPAADALLSAAAQHASQIALASNPQIRAGKVAEAVATKRAIAPIEVQNEVAKQVALAKNSPDAFAGITDHSTRLRAESAYEKDSHEYADKIGAAQQLQDFVRAAQSGNKAAPGLIPIQEVKQLVNRVNRQELESVSRGAGSAYDHLQGVIGGLTEGQPIPKAVLTDIDSISKTMSDAAKRTYNYKVQVTNKTYGSKAEPVDLAQPQTPQTAAPAQHKVGDTVTYQGKAHKITAIQPDGKLVLAP